VIGFVEQQRDQSGDFSRSARFSLIADRVK
jgi:hypothetical protein